MKAVDWAGNFWKALKLKTENKHVFKACKTDLIRALIDAHEELTSEPALVKGDDMLDQAHVKDTMRVWAKEVCEEKHCTRRVMEAFVDAVGSASDMAFSTRAMAIARGHDQPGGAKGINRGGGAGRDARGRGRRDDKEDSE